MYENIYANAAHTVCQRSSGPFYVVTYVIKKGSLLLGHIGCYNSFSMISASGQPTALISQVNDK